MVTHSYSVQTYNNPFFGLGVKKLLKLKTEFQKKYFMRCQARIHGFCVVLWFKDTFYKSFKSWYTLYELYIIIWYTNHAWITVSICEVNRKIMTWRLLKYILYSYIQLNIYKFNWLYVPRSILMFIIIAILD